MFCLAHDSLLEPSWRPARAQGVTVRKRRRPLHWSTSSHLVDRLYHVFQNLMKTLRTCLREEMHAIILSIVRPGWRDVQHATLSHFITRLLEATSTNIVRLILLHVAWVAAYPRCLRASSRQQNHRLAAAFPSGSSQGGSQSCGCRLNPLFIIILSVFLMSDEFAT